MDDVGLRLTASTLRRRDPDALTLERVWPTLGVSYNRFHTTAICSPTRAALLTGRNHHARRHRHRSPSPAADFDGYTRRDARRPRATMAEVLQATTATTPAASASGTTRRTTQITAMGPFDRWPTGLRLRLLLRLPGRRDVASTSRADHAEHHARSSRRQRREGYHLHRRHRGQGDRRGCASSAPTRRDKPFFMYWAPGAAHGPHHVAQGVGRQVQGQVRRRLGRLPRADLRAPEAAGLDPARHRSSRRAPMHGPRGTRIPDAEKPFQRAADGGLRRLRRSTPTANVGRVHRRDRGDGRAATTRSIFYIWGDNGASAGGP
ncbi:MAG: sulfatase-like hydrolase/transferase [Desulfobacterales bacterium]|nr:sulfatase-like hydrolase/transferase [Desulfobacterales bacterium]